MDDFEYHEDGTKPTNGEVFVFGSNLAGRHGMGAAKVALEFGAMYGVGRGRCGQTYAVPTKDVNIKTLSISDIVRNILEFELYTHSSHQTKFFITRVACGLAGYRDSDIAPLFRNCNKRNCNMPEPWHQYLTQTSEPIIERNRWTL